LWDTSRLVSADKSLNAPAPDDNVPANATPVNLMAVTLPNVALLVSVSHVIPKNWHDPVHVFTTLTSPPVDV
jgi:hypothetical protein